jgi:hypothetical protein
MLDTVKIAILGGALLMWLASYRLRGEIGTVFEEHRRVIIWGLGALILILILGGSGWQWSLAMLVGAMALGGLEVQWFLEGRRRGRLVGVTANWVETIWFSHRVNLALLAASGIAAAMVLAFGL